MKKIILLVLASLLAGCATYKTYNQTNIGRVKIRGGVHKELAWDDSLFFKRMSWYHGMTLYFDTLVYKADISSPFSNWFSASEKEYFNKCEKLVVTVSYSADPAKISHVDFREQMRLNGYDDVVVNDFAAALKNHPDNSDWSLKNYKILGFCKRSPSKLQQGRIVINFPSFSEEYINL
ncbi:MAG: hypothetical protein ACOVP4_00785 [Bacteriovoracaceae bacterium]|jgi:hypothetical protein